MNRLRKVLRGGFLWLERGLGAVFPPAWNPLYHLGPLGFFCYWIVAVSGIYVFIFFDTGTTEAYESLDYMTHDQWYLAGVMRSLHRYASDAMVLFMLVHLVREFSLDRYRGSRWFIWVTGVPILWMVFASGVTGYWLVWDKLAQYVAIATTEWFDALPIFGEPIARNFLSPQSLDDRFFSLLIFIHIAVPLLLLLVLFIHLQRLSRPRINPARGLAAGSFAMLLVLSLVKPATSQGGPADLTTVAAVVDLDWFYLGLYPLLDVWSSGTVWGVAGVLTFMLSALPWMPPMRRPPAAAVDLDNCNGCRRCVDDCPFAAVTMQPRSDGKPFTHEAVVDPALCVSCGICAGACPTSTPFRRATALVPGIDLPHLPLRVLRDRVEAAAAGLAGDGRILLFGCGHGVAAKAADRPGVAAIELPCLALLPPSFIDYVLSRRLADGVFLGGCAEEQCYNRLGVRWMQERLAGARDPRLRARVPRERIAALWATPLDRRRLDRELAAFAARLRDAGRLAAAAVPERALEPSDG